MVTALINILSTSTITDIVIVPQEITCICLLRLVNSLPFLKRSTTQNGHFHEDKLTVYLFLEELKNSTIGHCL